MLDVKGVKCRRVMACLIAMILAAVFQGCGDPPQPPKAAYVIKTGPVMVLPQDFARELDIKLAAYPYGIQKNVTEYNQLVLELASGLADESVLLAAAMEMGIMADAQEIEQAETHIREDYPEDSFDQMLLENAISYAFWKKKLVNQLVIEKLIRQSLESRIEITPDDVVSFYHRQKAEAGKKEGDTASMDEEKLVVRLRHEKSQKAYDSWIQELKEKYPVDIDQDALAAFLIQDIPEPIK